METQYDNIAHYDKIAAEYGKWLELPVVPYIVEYTYFNQLGDLTGKSILDFGCGDGFFTRKFKHRGAAQVVGVDIVEKMIELATQKETQEPLGIEYVVGDVTELGVISSFDLVASSFVLTCLPTKEKLLKACQSIFTNLKPGGRFVGLNFNVKSAAESYPICKKYGYGINVSGSIEEEIPILTSAIIDGQELSFCDHYFSKATYEWAFQTAGFKEIYWPTMIVSPQGIEEYGEEFWQDYLDYQLDYCIECIK